MNAAFKPRHSLLLVFVLLALGLVYLVGRDYQSVRETPEETSGDKADVTLDSIDYTETRDGRPLWRLRAASGSHDLATGLTRLEKVQVVFFGRKPGNGLSLKADSGLWDRESGEIQAIGHVEARDQRGYTVQSARMHYDQQKRLVWTDETVRLTGAGMEVKGRGLRLDIEARRLKLLADVWSRWQFDRFGEGRG